MLGPERREKGGDMRGRCPAPQQRDQPRIQQQQGGLPGKAPREIAGFRGEISGLCGLGRAIRLRHDFMQKGRKINVFSWNRIAELGERRCRLLLQGQPDADRRTGGQTMSSFVADKVMSG